MTVEEWLGKDNQLGQDIWHKKYQHGNETFDEWLDRVSGGDSDVANLIKEKKFLFGGRILANRGLQNKGKKITYSNCFKAGTKVLTKSGYRPIEAIQIGEQVYTHDGSLQVVNEVMKRDYSGDLYRISGKEIYNDIYCTPNHQFLTNNGWKRADELVFCSNGHKKIDKLCTINERIPIKPLTIDLLEGINLPENREICYNGNNDVGLKQCIISEHFNNYWREPRFNNYVHQHITIDEDMSYFIGRWLGDGSITKRKDSSLYSILQIVFNAQTERAAFERCKSIGEKAFGISASYRETNQNTIALRFENALVGDWFYRNFGAGCDGKHVNTEKFGYNFYMLLGLLDADGSVHKQGDFKLLLKNQNLVLWARDTLFNNGINSSQIKSETRQTADYFTIFKHQNQKLIPYLTKIYNDNRMDLIQTDCFIKISDIEKLSDQHLTVYNLSVENNHNYIVEGVVAHNCYVIEPPKDNIESIYETASKLARTYSYGGGCGIDISKLAPKGAPVNNAANETSGAVSFMDTFSQVTEQIGQNGRRAALMISMDCSHPDLEDFIDVKKDLDKVTKANISVRFSDEFMQAVNEDRTFNLNFSRPESNWATLKPIKAKEVFKKLAYNNWEMAEPGCLFWDRIKNYNLLSEYDGFSYAGVNPCAEEPLPAGGSCLLGSLNLSEFVDENKVFDFSDFLEAVNIAVMALNEVLIEGMPLHPLKEQRKSVNDWRQIGLGICGLADMLIKMEIPYGSERSIKLCENIGYAMACQAILSSSEIARDSEPFPKLMEVKVNNIIKSKFFTENVKQSAIVENVRKYGLANSQLLTIAPTGTISTMLGISGGIEPIFANSYTRKTESLHGKDKYYKVYTPIVEKYMKEHGITDEKDLPDFFVTAADLDYHQRIDMQSTWQKHIDASISSTVNVPNDFTPEQVYDLYLEAWMKNCKGITIFRDGCKRTGILTTKTEKQNTAAESTTELKRGEVAPSSEDLIGIKKKLMTGCGSLHLCAFYDPIDFTLKEIFLSKGSTGGCSLYMNGLSRMISLAARAGVGVEDIVDQLMSTGSCPSYATRAAAKHDTSKGSCCPMAIGYALRELQETLDGPIVRKEDKNNKVAILESKTTKEKCPECGAALEHSGGCDICTSCGYSHCG